MLLVLAAKALAMSALILGIAISSLGIALIFSGYLASYARNPELGDALFNGALLAFALIESMLFLSIIITLVFLFL